VNNSNSSEKMATPCISSFHRTQLWGGGALSQRGGTHGQRSVRWKCLPHAGVWNTRLQVPLWPLPASWSPLTSLMQPGPECRHWAGHRNEWTG